MRRAPRVAYADAYPLAPQVKEPRMVISTPTTASMTKRIFDIVRYSLFLFE